MLAQRDVVTGLPNTRAFERAIDRRLASRAPFALLIGDFDAISFPEDRDQGLRLLADTLRGVLGPDTDLARVGADELAVLTACDGLEQAAQLAVRLERTLCETGALVTFGWSSVPPRGRERSHPVPRRRRAALRAAGAARAARAPPARRRRGLSCE